MEEIKIITPAIKLNQLVKFAGFTKTGAEANVKIDLGEVYLNGEYCTKRGKKVKPGDIIEFENKKYKVVYDEEAAAEAEAAKAAAETIMADMTDDSER